jgi:hypothetical protein
MSVFLYSFANNCKRFRSFRVCRYLLSPGGHAGDVILALFPTPIMRKLVLLAAVMAAFLISSGPCRRAGGSPMAGASYLRGAKLDAG